MLRIITLVVLVFVNFVLQSTLFPEITILGVIPDTALVLIVSYAILRREIEGALFGMFVGFVQDAASGMFIGIFAMLGFVIGYVCGKPFKNFFKDNYFLPFFIVVLASLAHQFALYIATVLFTGQVNFFHYARTIILPKTIYTASLSVPIYAFLHFINLRLERREKNLSFFLGKNEDD